MTHIIKDDPDSWKGVDGDCEFVTVKEHWVHLWTDDSTQAAEDWATGKISFNEFLQRFGENIKRNVIKGMREKLTDEGMSVEGMSDDEILQYTSLQF